MKQALIFLSLATVLLFGSCSKKNNVSLKSTITATVDGQVMNFNVNAYARNVLSGDPKLWTTSLTIQGATSSAKPYGSILLAIASPRTNPVTLGTFDTDSKKNNPPVFVELGYDYIHVGDFIPAFNTDTTGVQPTVITISSYSNTNVAGTFSGILVAQDGSSIKTITNGSFNVSWQQQ